MGVEDPELTSPDSSTEIIADATETDVSAETGSESSTESAGDTKFDPLSVVRDVVSKSRSKSASPAEGQDQSDQKPKAAPDSKPQAAAGDDPDPPPFNKHPRWQQLIRERDEFKADAGQYRQIQQFLTTNGVEPAEAAQALQLAALVKSDPQKAWEILKPTVTDLLQRTGQLLSPDLKDQVAQGRLTREAALEISRLRAANANTQQAVKFQQDARERAAQIEQDQARMNAAAVWEQSRSTDPDYLRLADEVKKEILWRRSQGQVARTPEEVRKQLDEAWSAVKKAHAKPAPRPAVPQPARVTGRVATGQPAAKPPESTQDMALDVIRRVRGATG